MQVEAASDECIDDFQLTTLDSCGEIELSMGRHPAAPDPVADASHFVDYAIVVGLGGASDKSAALIPFTPLRGEAEGE